MLINMMPGANADNLYQAIVEILGKAKNVRDASGHPYELLTQYNTRAIESAGRLRGQLAPAVIDRVVFTRRYELLLGATDASANSIPPLIRIEIDHRMVELEELRVELDRQIGRWSVDDESVLVGPDTTFYIRGPKIDQDDLRETFKIHRKDIRILVPLVVLTELDRLKESGDEHTRWRADYTLAVFDRIFENQWMEPARLVAENIGQVNGGVRPVIGETTVEILPDPRGHISLPDPDEEIIERLKSVEPLAGRPVTLFTFDTSQRFRAAMVNLSCVKLAKEMGPEPSPRIGPSARQLRRERQQATAPAAETESAADQPV